MNVIRASIAITVLIQSVSSWAATTNNPSYYDQGVKSVNSREWDKAIASFEQALKLLGYDYASKMYINRCKFFKESPPPDNWNGAFVMETK